MINQCIGKSLVWEYFLCELNCLFQNCMGIVLERLCIANIII